MTVARKDEFMVSLVKKSLPNPARPRLRSEVEIRLADIEHRSAVSYAGIEVAIDELKQLDDLLNSDDGNAIPEEGYLWEDDSLVHNIAALRDRVEELKMSDTFTFKGTVQVVHGATDTDPSGDFDIISTINETMNVKKKESQTISLDTDSIKAVSLGDCAAAHVLVIRSSIDLTVTISSTKGNAQVLPAGKLFVLMNVANPITAVSLTRQPGVSTTARVIICELQP